MSIMADDEKVEVLANTEIENLTIIGIWTQRLYYIIAIDEICFDEFYIYVKWT
jgi:hypothetical protein